MPKIIRAFPAILQAAFCSLLLSSCDETTSPTPPVDTAQASNPNNADLAPTCTTSAYTDDTISITSSVPGAKIYWGHQPVENYFLRSSRFEPYAGPLEVGDGLQAFAVSPRGDTSRLVHCPSGIDPTNTLKSPVIRPSYKAFDYPVDSVSITSTMPGVTIHFTIDGSQPTASSRVYAGKIPFYGPLLIRAIAVAPGWHQSLSVRHLFISQIAPWNEKIHYDTLQDPRDGQRYPVVKMGSQTWMAKNLNWHPPVDVFHSASSGGMYPPGMAKSPGLCPVGWRVPTTSDWTTMRDWALSQPGVTQTSLANALLATGMGNSDEAVDLFGFRATGSAWWTSTSVTVGYTGQVSIVGTTFSVGNISDSATRWVFETEYDPDGPTFNDGMVSVPVTNPVRCVKETP